MLCMRERKKTCQNLVRMQTIDGKDSTMVCNNTEHLLSKLLAVFLINVFMLKFKQIFGGISS